MSEHREWLKPTVSMGVKLPDGRSVIVRRGDRVLVATDASGLPRVLSVMIDLQKSTT